MTDEQKEIFLLKLKLELCIVALTEIRDRKHYIYNHNMSDMREADYIAADYTLKTIGSD